MNKSVFSKGVSEGLDGCANAGTLICRMPTEGNFFFFFLCSIILYGARLLIGVWADFEPTHLKLFIFFLNSGGEEDTVVKIGASCS